MRVPFVNKKLLWSLVVAASAPVFPGGCASTTNKPPGAQPTLMDKLSNGAKSASASLTAAMTPKQTPDTSTPVAPNGKPGPSLFVAMAQMSERSGNLDEAESQYRKALNLDPNNLQALLGYAHLEDGRHDYEAAMKLYQTALKKHSREAAVHNDMALCYQRRGMPNDAVKCLRRAVELNPSRKLYRDNLAMVYVELGNSKEALSHLIVAHGEAVGNYDLAYLLMKKDENEAALVHFRKAVEKDPSLVAARQWIDNLSPSEKARGEPQTNEVATFDESSAQAEKASATLTLNSGASESTGVSQLVVRTKATTVDPPAQSTAVRSKRPAAASGRAVREAMAPAEESQSDGQASASRLPTVEPGN